MLIYGDLAGLSEAGARNVQAGHRVSLWLARLDVSASTLHVLEGCLSSEERARAQTLRRPRDRRRFLAARGWQRQLLAGQLGCDPGEIRFVRGDSGKPRLAGSDLRFNAARSGRLALYATSPTMEVGVDIEAIQPTADVDRIAARFFSPAEQDALAALPPGQRVVAFFECWTRKEAYVKGIGTGLGVPVHTMDVWNAETRCATVAGWSVRQLEGVGPGFAAAVAGPDLSGWLHEPVTELGVPTVQRLARGRREGFTTTWRLS